MVAETVIVGASLAGLKVAESLRRRGHSGPIRIIGAETHLPYDRPPLSKQLLTGACAPADTALRLEDGLEVDWILGNPATALDLNRRVVRVGKNEISFDRLVIATGASPRVIPNLPPGRGVHYLRTLDDAVALAADLAQGRHLAVVGAGFIGLEVASCAKQLGKEVTVLATRPVPLERAFGPEIGMQLAAWHSRHGLDLVLGAGVEVTIGTGNLEGVLLKDGSLVEADVVLVGIGAAPATDWLEGSGIDLDDGVLCDERLRVLAAGRPLTGIVAAGDVARWKHPGYGKSTRVEHWTNAIESAEVAARTLLNEDEFVQYSPTPYVWSDQNGMKIQFVGRVEPGDRAEVIEGSFEEDCFVVAYERDDRLVAALAIGRPARVMAMQAQIAEGISFRSL